MRFILLGSNRLISLVLRFLIYVQSSLKPTDLIFSSSQSREEPSIVEQSREERSRDDWGGAKRSGENWSREEWSLEERSQEEQKGDKKIDENFERG